MYLEALDEAFPGPSLEREPGKATRCRVNGEIANRQARQMRGATAGFYRHSSAIANALAALPTLESNPRISLACSGVNPFQHGPKTWEGLT